MRSKPVENIAVVLAVAGEVASITVSASRKNEDSNVNMDRNADQLSFEKQNLEDLPTQDQNPLALVGSFASPASQGAEGLNVVVDGVEMSVSSLPAGSIRRIRVNHNPYSTRFRRPGKGRVEVLTEEGSLRRLRGGFTYSARNSLFDARHPFASTRPDQDRRLFAGNFSAPIVKQKATFFVTAEHLADNQTAVVNALTLNGPFVANVSTPSQRTSMLSRFDWKPTDRTTLYALYTFRDESQANRGVGGFRLPEQGIPEAERQHRLQLSGSSVVTNHLINEVRLSLDRETRSLGRDVAAPAIIVNGAFNGGAPQSFRTREETGVRIQDVATYYAGRHSILFGAEYRPGWYAAVDRSNFGGTFQFANLSEFALNHPFTFSQNQGNPAVSFLQSEMFGFAQDEIHVLPSLTVTAGFRYSWQSNVSHPNGIAPRLSFAYAFADHKTVLRGGAGWFHERVSEEITRGSLLYDGIRVRQIVIPQPSFPDIGAALASGPPSTIRVSNDLQPAGALSGQHRGRARTLEAHQYHLGVSNNPRHGPASLTGHQCATAVLRHASGPAVPEYRSGRVRWYASGQCSCHHMARRRAQVVFRNGSVYAVKNRRQHERPLLPSRGQPRLSSRVGPLGLRRTPSLQLGRNCRPPRRIPFRHVPDAALECPV